jgi:predicted extracellular nuclease
MRMFSSTLRALHASASTHMAAIAAARTGLVLALFAAFSNTAFAVSPNLVISQVYGGGGNAGSVYTRDYIEIFNRSAVPVTMTNWSVQYAAATGTAWTVTTLNGTVPAGGYFLVAQAAGAGGTTALPTPEVTGTIAMSATAGKVALVNTNTALTGACPTGAQIVDFVGFGTTANCFEGTAPTPAPSNINAVLRSPSSCTDTDANNTDFVAGAPNPRNTATAVISCSSLPTLSINNVTLAEGNVGPTTFAFTVSLSAPAGAGGVSFNIATADGTATAGSDYVAQILTAQTIPAGASSYTFNVTVNGDTLPEIDETFTVNVSSVVGATVVTGTGTGTITNDDAAPNLTINNVSQIEGNSGTSNFVFTVSLSAPAPAGGVTFDIATANGTATAGSDYVAQLLTAQTIVAGASTYTFTVVVNGDPVGEPNETFSVNVTNIVNAIGVATTGTGSILNDDIYPIHTIQGSGNASPFATQLVTVEGIVTGDFQGANQLKGFYIQEPDAKADADPLTSEGVFVFTGVTPYAVAAGDLVRVTGTVTEFGTAPNTLTEIVTPTITTLSSGNALPAVTVVTLPVATLGELERYEGMLVRFSQTLTVSDHFDLAHFGEVTLSANGRTLQPTSQVDPNDDPAAGTNSSGNANGANVTAFADLNARSKILLDDASTLTYPATVPFLDPATNTLRLGSTVANLTGILSQSFGTHRLYATTPPAFVYAARPATPPAVGGNVKVASMNVLNYFNGDGLGGGFPTSRGADSLNEFNRQRAKVLAAVRTLNADVVGLLEIENDGGGANSAIQDLVNGLNASAGAGAWAFVADPAGWGTFPGSTDQIRPAFIYKTAVVATVGAAVSPNDTAFSIGRAPVAQTFRVLSNNEQFIAIINHFKAKGGTGTGLDADLGDGQAAFNNTRKLQSSALINFINTLTPTTPRVIAMGDFNAYEQEDPIDVMRAGGLSTIINNSYSYMFDGQTGSLDHALGNAALMGTVSGFGKWHINADEPVFLDYNVETKNTAGCTSSCTSPDFFAATPFRASDHDPVLVGLNLLAAQTITFPPLTNFAVSASTIATATASSTLTVTYSVVSGPCLVTGATVTATAAGTCIINADQTGNASFSPAVTVQQTVTVSAGTQTITFPVITSFSWLGGSAQLTATATSGLTVTYSIASGPCAVSGNTLTATAAGTCTVNAYQAGNAAFAAAATVQLSVTVSVAAQTISFPMIVPFSWNGGSATLAATASSGLPVTYTVTSGVCTLSGTTITSTAAGACNVSAAQVGNANYATAASVVQAALVTASAQTVTFPAITPFAWRGGSATLGATASSGLSITYAVVSGPCSVAGVTLTATAAGSCTVSAAQFGNVDFAAVTNILQSVNIAPGAQTVSFGALSNRTYGGAPFALTAIATSGLPVLFASSTPSVCGVNGNTVTLLLSGTCTISATQAGDANNTAAATVLQSFSVAIQSQTIAFVDIPAQVASAAPFLVSARSSAGLEVVMTSLTPGVCTATQLQIGAPINSPFFTITLTGTPGRCTLRATQPGIPNAVDAAATVERSFEVSAQFAASTVRMQSTQNPALIGGVVTLIADIQAASPTGSVRFVDYGVAGSNVPPTVLCVAQIVAARASCTLARASQSESRLYSAVYSGNATTASGEATLTQAFKNINLGVLPQQTIIGAPVKLIATLPTTARSTVAFARDGVPILACTAVPVVVGASLNTASCTVTATAAFARYTATYAADTAESPGYATATPASDRTNHWWAGVAENGWGLVINQHGETPFVALYIYNAAGKPDWLAMSGVWDASKTTFSGDFYRPTSAPLDAYDAARFAPGAVVGRGSFTFNTESTGDFTYNIDGRSGSKAIRKLEFSGPAGGLNTNLSDLWWNPSENGWGISLSYQNNAIFAVWYTYGVDGKPTWLAMSNGSWSGNTYTGTLYRTQGSAWLGVPYNAAQFSPTAVGSMSFRFLDANTADLTYTVDGVTQTKTITRQPY